MIASIQKVLSVEPVPDSDNLDKIMVLGWQVVTRRGEYTSGDLCVYVELDSILPDGPEWSEFMRPRGFRIKSIKLRRCMSQGLALPLDILGNIVDLPIGTVLYEGCDVSELLNIIHYEKPVPANLQGQIRGSFPPYCPKTNEERIQNFTHIYDELNGVEVYSTVKYDGTSATYISRLCPETGDMEFHVCSRNNDIKINDENKDNAYVRMAFKYDIENRLRKLNRSIVIQGEICGPGVQRNPMNLPELDLFIFNVYKLDQRCYAGYDEFRSIIAELGMKTVPIIGTWVFNHTQEQLLEMAEGTYEGSHNPREGIVIRPLVEMYSHAIKGRMSFKVLSNSYLLKNKE